MNDNSYDGHLPHASKRRVEFRRPATFVVRCDVKAGSAETRGLASTRSHKVYRTPLTWLLTIVGGSHGLTSGDQQLIAKALARAREFIKENLRSAAALQPAAQSSAP